MCADLRRNAGRKRRGVVAALAAAVIGVIASSCAHRGEPFEPVHVNPRDSTKVAVADYGRWTRKKSPYYVMKSVVVPKGRKLIIDPGVTVVFTKPGQNLTINGTLVAVGKGVKDSTITFRPTVRGDGVDPNPGDWGSLVLTGGSTARLAYTNFRWATAAIQAIDVDSLTVEHTDIKYSMVSGIELTRSSIALRNSTISINGSHGIHLKQCEDPFNSVLIDNCNIGYNQLAGIFSSGSTVLVMRSDIMNNGVASERSPDMAEFCGGAHFEGTPGIQVPLFVMCNIELNTPCDIRNIMPNDIMVGADSTWWGDVTTNDMNDFSTGAGGQPNKKYCGFNVYAICDGQDMASGQPTVRFCWWRDQRWPNDFSGNAPEDFAFRAPMPRWR